MGHVKFLFFYLACGVFAGLFHAWMLPGSDVPLIGASGAVAGVIAAYLMLHPRVGVWVLAFKFIPAVHFRRARARHLDRAAGGDDRHLRRQPDGPGGPISAGSSQARR
jgi:Rhomboid family